jgi:hypothetical protein
MPLTLDLENSITFKAVFIIVSYGSGAMDSANTHSFLSTGILACNLAMSLEKYECDITPSFELIAERTTPFLYHVARTC